MTIRQSSNGWSLILLALGTFLLGTDAFVLNGLLPSIAGDLAVPVATAGQLTTVFAATYAVSSPLIAALTGSWERRWLLSGGLVLFTVGMAGQAFGGSFAVVAAARVLAAIGAAAFQSNAYVIAGALAAPQHRGRALATVAAGMSVSLVLGVPIGVLAGNWLGWRAVLAVIGGAGVLLALAIPLLPAVRVPAVGLATRLSVVARPPVARLLLVTVLSAVSTFGVFVYLPVIAEPVAAGAAVSWLLVGNGIGQVFGNSLAGRWTDRLGADRVRRISLCGVAAVLLLVDLAGLSLPSLVLAVLLVGVFAGMLMVPQQHRLFALAPDAPTVALGLNGSAIYLGGALGSAFGGLLLAGAGPAWLAPAGALVSLLALVASYRKTSAAKGEAAVVSARVS